MPRGEFTPQGQILTSVEFVLRSYRAAGDKRTDEEILRERDAVRQQTAELFSSSPLYQQRAKNNPDYWKTFDVGAVRMLKMED